MLRRSFLLLCLAAMCLAAIVAVDATAVAADATIACGIDESAHTQHDHARDGERWHSFPLSCWHWRAHRVASLLPVCWCAACPSLDFSALSSTFISSTDWANMNFYWHPCGTLESDPDVPALCKSVTAPQFATSSFCQIQQFTKESTDLGDWSSQGLVRWSLLNRDTEAAEESGAIQSLAGTGAALSMRSALSNCPVEMQMGDMQVSTTAAYTVTIQLTCDESGQYPLHGPLAPLNEGPCNFAFRMQTKLACSPKLAERIERTRMQQAIPDAEMYEDMYNGEAEARRNKSEL